MLDILTTEPGWLSRILNGVRIGSAPVGRSSLTRRLSCIGAAGMGLILLAGWSPWRPGVVSGRSMEPSLRPGNVFLFQHLKTEPRQLHPGEVVLLRREGETWIKRIYATAGTRFWVLRERDGERRYSRPIRAGQQARFSRIARFFREQGRQCEVVQVEVPPGKVFVMGDAQCSRDSRELGPVPVSAIVGKVVSTLPAGGARMPDEAELSFPTPVTFARFGAAAPPSVLKRDAWQRRARDARRAAVRARAVDARAAQSASAA